MLANYVEVIYSILLTDIYTFLNYSSATYTLFPGTAPICFKKIILFYILDTN